MKPRIENCVFVDFETVVSGDFSLEKLSTQQYVTDPRFDVLCVAIAFAEGPVRVYHKGGPGNASLEQAQAVLLEASDRTFVAHNVGFDGFIAKHLWGVTFARHFDTTGYARALGLDARLANAAAFFGKRKLEAPPFTAASLADPGCRERMARYCATDTALARLVFRKAVADDGYPDAEFEINDMTAAINLRGLRVDTASASRLARELGDMRADALEQFARKFSFDTTDLTRPAKVKTFIESQWGVKLPSLDKRDPRRSEATEAAPEARQFLELRQRIQTLRKAGQLAQAYAKIECGRVYNFLRYFGSHTGRFTAGGRDACKLNVHQLFKTKNDSGILELGRERMVIVPGEGRSFCSADLSNIEARIVAWMAGEKELLEQFARPDVDVYTWFAQPIFPGVEIVKGGDNDHLRQLGKQAVLGLGFGMGLEKFLERVRAAVPGVDEHLVTRMFDAYQGMFPRIRRIRYDLHRRFAAAADERTGSTEAPCPIRFTNGPTAGPTVVVHLPTGRSLYYRSVVGADEPSPWGTKRAYWYAPSAVCLPTLRARGRGQGQRRFPDGQIRARVTPQVLIENVVQATARDLMAHQAMELERHGLRVAFHAHDEIVAECDACRCPGTQKHSADCPWLAAGQVMELIMSSVPATLPGLSGLPVACELKSQVRLTYAG